MRPPLLLFLALASWPLSGCCSLARLFCGPDKSPWISVRFDTPHHAAQTLFEAIRRDDPQIVYLCLSQAYRQRLGIDSMSAQIAWEKLREQNPGLHVAGYAVVPQPTCSGADRAAVTVQVEGTTIDLDLERQSYWEVRCRLPDGTVLEQGAVVPSFADRIAVTHDPVNPRADDAITRIDVLPLAFVHDPDVAVPSEAVEHAALTRLWKISRLRVQQ